MGNKMVVPDIINDIENNYTVSMSNEYISDTIYDFTNNIENNIKNNIENNYIVAMSNESIPDTVYKFTNNIYNNISDNEKIFKKYSR